MGTGAALSVERGSSSAQNSANTPVAHRKRYDLTNEAAAGFILLLLFLLGALAMLPVSADILRLWRDDPLRSFGALLPVVALLLWVRRWRTLNWTRNGTAWGLLPMGIAVVVARTYGSSLIAYSFGSVEFAPLQPGLLFFLYGSGVALLLGGVRLWRAVLFPLCLLLFVNPVPHIFDKLDTPLQSASANVTRTFAHLIGLYPSGIQLQMMFAPRFGLVIVPGCNGVRGSATMAYLGLLLGYVRHQRWFRTALHAAAGLLLGYLLNFVRLCCLVVYYRLALSHPQWHTDGEKIDYIIGGTLFVLLTALGGFLLLRPQVEAEVPLQVSHTRALPQRVHWLAAVSNPRWMVAAVFLFVSAVSEVPAAWSAVTEPSGFIAPDVATQTLPATVGPWQRQRVWTEVYDSRPVWLWSSYRRADGRMIDMGVWLSPKRHYGIQSLLMNGSKPVAGAGFTASSGDELPMQFSSYTLDDATGDTKDLVPTYFAETMCLPRFCSERALGFTRKGWLIAVTPMAAREQRRLPLLWRVQGPEGTPQSVAGEKDAEALVADMAKSLQVATLVKHLGALNSYRN